MMRLGGLERLVSSRMALFRDGERKNGVAIVRIGKREVCAILSNGRACVKAPTGYTATTEYELLRGWSWSS